MMNKRTLREREKIRDHLLIKVAQNHCGIPNVLLIIISKILKYVMADRFTDNIIESRTNFGNSKELVV